MYNLDAYIADFLSDHKKLSAQGIGEFAIVNGQAPNGAPLVEFIYNKGAYTTDDLIGFISEHQGKNKIVTGFDVESHFNQVKQFINIGTPWVIPGFGQLQLGKSRELEFLQQTPNENALHERSKRKQAATEANYQTYDVQNPATQRTGNTGTILLTLFIIIALGAGGYYFYNNKSDIISTSMAADTAATLTDTVISVPSSSNMNNTVTSTQPPLNQTATSSSLVGASGYRFVLNRTANGGYAMKRYNQLKSYGIQVYMDSVRRDSYSLYKIYLVKDALPSDTAKLKDSLTKYYGRPVKLEAQ